MLPAMMFHIALEQCLVHFNAPQCTCDPTMHQYAMVIEPLHSKDGNEPT